MHVIVTGASGFVGRALVGALATSGTTGLAVARRSIDRLPTGWTFVARDEVLASPFEGVDAVIHLEARHHQYVIGEGSPEQVAEFTTTNVENTRAWLQWCARAAVGRFVFFSSIKAIDPARASDPAKALDETTPGPGATLYGRSKWNAERTVAAWVETPGRAALILRPAVIYGPGSTANIYAMVAAIAQRRFVFVGSNDNIKSLVSLRNVAAATRHLLHRMAPGCEIYHLVDRHRYSVRELAAMIARQLNVPPPSLSVPGWLVRPPVSLADRVGRLTGGSLPITSARLEALCENADFSPAKLLASGFVHPQTTEEGLAEMVRWYRATAAAGRAAES